MIKLTQKEFKRIDFISLIEQCLASCDDFYTYEGLQKYAAEAIEKGDYCLTIHLLKTLENNTCNYYFYDADMDTIMVPQPIRDKKDILTTEYVEIIDMEEPDEEILEEIDWELKISYQYTHLIIQDGAIMANDIMELAETLMRKYDLDELEVYHGESKVYNCAFINGEVDIVRKL